MAHVFDELAGEWSGEGDGEYPTIAPFGYRETLTITPVPGRPVALWVSRTRDAATGEPRHGEAGFLRAVDDGVELVVAHSFGVTEVTTGSFLEGALTLDSRAVTLAPSAKQIAAVQRRYRFGGDACTYRIAMAAVGVDLTHHLEATLRRS
jgi:hypothetical protein